MNPRGDGFIITGNKRFKIPNFGNSNDQIYLWNNYRIHTLSNDQINSIQDSGEI
jgi:hypothetical protein